MMSRSRSGSVAVWIIAAALLATLMASTTSGVLGGTTKDGRPDAGALRQAEITMQQEPGQWVQYQVPFYDAQGIVRLTATIRVSLLNANLYETRVTLAHTTGTRIDAFTFEYEFPQLVPPFALRTPPGAPWPPLQFQRTEDFQGVFIEAGDLGFVGAGVLTIEHVLGPVATPEWLADTFLMRLTVDLVEISPADPARYHADGALDIAFPHPAVGQAGATIR
jgi:hypothetical protein